MKKKIVNFSFLLEVVINEDESTYMLRAQNGKVVTLANDYGQFCKDIENILSDIRKDIKTVENE